MRKEIYVNGSKVMPRKYAPGTDPWYNHTRTPGLKDLVTETGMPRGLCRKALQVNHFNKEGAKRWLALPSWRRPEVIKLDEDGTFDVEAVYSKIEQAGAEMAGYNRQLPV